MRVFGSCCEMLNETAREVFSRGTWCYDKTRQAREVTERAKELIGYAYRLTSFHDLDQMFDLAREIFGKDFLRKEIAETWFQEMISEERSNPQKFWFMHPELKEYFLKYCAIGRNKVIVKVKQEKEDVVEGVRVFESYTYNERVSKNYKIVLDLLVENIERKAAVIPVFWELDLYNVGIQRVPCSMFYQFLARKTVEGYKLHLIYVQRSCDLAWFFTFDTYRAIRLLQKAVEDLNKRGLEISEGHLIHFISSLHVFESDINPRYRW